MGVFMVVQQRNEVGRNRILHILAIVLAAAVLFGVISVYSTSSGPMQIVFIVLGLTALAGLAIAVIQLIGFPKRSQVLLFHLENRMIVATNNQHEGFKLRFLRDILGDSVGAFSDEDRVYWKRLESDGYYPSMYIRNPKKSLMLRLCTMVFDDVYVADLNDRWEHHDASNTSEPTFSHRQMPPLKTWKGSSKISA
jgi:hypothetical protein